VCRFFSDFAGFAGGISRSNVQTGRDAAGHRGSSSGAHFARESRRLLFEQGLLIVGRVAMWRPLEIFLYDWWPILGERRIHDGLSRMQVRIALRTEPPDRPGGPTAAA
jgi:hypothetical protein